MTGYLQELALERGRSGLGPAPGRPVEQARNLALVKEDGAVAQALDRLGDVAREQDRRAGGGERAQLVLGRQVAGRVEALERLVAQEDGRTMEHGGDERQLLPHAVREAMDGLVAAVGQGQATEQVGGARLG